MQRYSPQPFGQKQEQKLIEYSSTHNLDSNEMLGEKARLEVHKDAASCFEQILEASSYKKQLYVHLTPISQTIHVRQARYAKSCWGSKDKLIINVLLWTPTHGHTSVRWSAKI